MPKQELPKYFPQSRIKINKLLQFHALEHKPNAIKILSENLPAEYVRDEYDSIMRELLVILDK